MSRKGGGRRGFGFGGRRIRDVTYFFPFISFSLGRGVIEANEF